MYTADSEPTVEPYEINFLTLQMSKSTMLMRNILLIICILIYGSIFAQNLAPNPSFEDTLECTFGLNNLSALQSWSSFGNSVDYYHSCDESVVIPNCPFGFQYAHTGEAMIGLVTYVWQHAPGWPYYREFAGAMLLDTLVVGQEYYAHFYMNHTGYIPGWQKIGANKLGIRFSTVPYSSTAPPEVDNFAHIYTDSIYVDSVQWYKVSGTFVADSAYTYIIIGNFFDHIQTDTIIYDGPPFGGSCAYYYVDDVCVSIYPECVDHTSVNHDREHIVLTIQPNPFQSSLTIAIDNFRPYRLMIFDGSARLVMVHEGIGNGSVDTSSLGQGMYFWKFDQDGESSRTGKIIPN